MGDPGLVVGAKRLFGTDGIRGEAGRYPLDQPTIERVGQALARVLSEDHPRPRILIARDPRESGPAIEAWLSRGLIAGGAEVVSAGILSTPAVAFLTKNGPFDAGAVISASHNDYHDNGIKVFSHAGFKLVDEMERRIEELVLDGHLAEIGAAVAPAVRETGADPVLQRSYVDRLATTLPVTPSLAGLKVVLDCANGAASGLAPEVFARLGAEVLSLSTAPDGRNINRDCGALHPHHLAAVVQREGAHLGAAFDGDADRCILVDESGVIRDGDDILAVTTGALHRSGALGPAGVVLTVMANLGLERYLAGIGVDHVRAAVGDKYVLDEMRRRGARLGGEQSGHVIFLDHATTGDGILTALQVAHIVAASGKGLGTLASCWTRLPQVLKNVRVRDRIDLKGVPQVAERLRHVEAALAGRGRLLVRYSGTEPVVRIMLEGQSLAEIQGHANELAEAIASVLG